MVGDLFMKNQVKTFYAWWINELVGEIFGLLTREKNCVAMVIDPTAVQSINCYQTTMTTAVMEAKSKYGLAYG